MLPCASQRFATIYCALSRLCFSFTHGRVRICTRSDKGPLETDCVTSKPNNYAIKHLRAGSYLLVRCRQHPTSTTLTTHTNTQPPNHPTTSATHTNTQPPNNLGYTQTPNHVCSEIFVSSCPPCFFFWCFWRHRLKDRERDTTFQQTRVALSTCPWDLTMCNVFACIGWHCM